jgi:hypothetical protein
LFRIRKVKRASPFQATFSLFSEHSIGEQEHNQINLKKETPQLLGGFQDYINGRINYIPFDHRVPHHEDKAS